VNPWLLRILALVGLGIYAIAYVACKWLGFDTVQSILLVLGLVVGLTGLAFEVSRRMENA
jgi:nitrate/nitrite transporter NarK